MKIEVVEVAKKVEKPEVPFVVGGVYTQYGKPLMLTKRNVEDAKRYQLVWLEEGCFDRNEMQTEDQIRRTLRTCDLVHIPDAYLAIPKEVDAR